MKILVIFLLIFLAHSIRCSKILIISQQPYLTNQKVAAKLANDLATRGHKITIFTSYYFGDYHKNVDEFNFDTETLPKVTRNSHKNWWQIYHDLTDFHYGVSKQQLKHKMIKRIFKKERKFDLLIIDCVICHFLAIAEVHDIPAIYLSPTEPLNFVNDHFGNEVNPSLHPETHAMSYKHGKLSLPQRFDSYFSFHYWKFFGGFHHCLLMRRALSAEYPSNNFTCHDLHERMQFLFIFTHPAFGNVRPLVPKTIQCGFNYVEKATKIVDKNLKSFLDESRNGAVIFNVDELHADEFKVFLNVFKELKLSVVLNVENSTSLLDEDFFMTKNAQLESIIGHPSIKFVVSTADYREVEVLLKNHMPMMLVPLTHEQIVIARLMVERKIARSVDVTKLSESQLVKNLNEMLANEKIYKENLRKLEAFASDRPKLKELAPWNVDFVIRHKGAKHLDYPGRKVPYYQKMFLDIYLFFGTLLFIGLKLIIVLWSMNTKHGWVKKIVKAAKMKKN